jgi:hypothetical protein
MNFQPSCPPLPSVDELLSNPSFYEVNMDELVPNENVICYVNHHPNTPIICLQIIANTNTHLVYRNPNFPNSSATAVKTAIQGFRFFRKDERRNYEEFMKKNIRVDMKKGELNKHDAIKRNVFQNMDKKIGDYLSDYPSRGGRKYHRIKKTFTYKTRSPLRNKKKTQKRKKINGKPKLKKN